MKKFYYILSFLVALVGSSDAAESLRIEEVTTPEQAQKVAPLYINYYQKELISETKFLDRWKEVQKDSGYHLLAAFNENSKAVAFIDGTIFASLYWQNLMRIDSFYIDPEIAQNQEQLSKSLFGSIEAIARKNKVYQIQCNTRQVHEQEVKLFDTNMVLNKEEMFYIKDLDEKK